jgi:hypothetical protein
MFEPVEPAWGAADPTPVAPGPPRRIRALILAPGTVLALVVLVIVAALVLPGIGGRAATHRSGPVGPPAPPPASPSGPPVTPEEYQQALDALGTAVGPGFGRLATARAPVSVDVAATELYAALNNAATRLRSVVPPAPVQAAHRSLVSGLDRLGVEMGGIAYSATVHGLCNGPSALSRAGASVAANGVRNAVGLLATADPAHPYKVAPFLPPAGDTDRRLANGTVIRKATTGPNALKVVNAFKVDAVVSLVAAGAGTAAVMLYVRAEATATVDGIRDGAYTTHVTTGSDWDPALQEFGRDCVHEPYTESGQTALGSGGVTVLSLTLGPDDANIRYDLNGLPR